MIDGQNSFDPPFTNNLRTYNSILKIATGQGDDYTLVVCRTIIISKTIARW